MSYHNLTLSVMGCFVLTNGVPETIIYIQILYFVLSPSLENQFYPGIIKHDMQLKLFAFFYHGAGNAMLFHTEIRCQ